MRLTQEIRKTILRNLVVDHTIYGLAKAVMFDTQKLALDIIASQMPQGVTTMAQLGKWRENQIAAINQSPFFGTNTYANCVVYSVREDGSPGRVRDAKFEVNLAGVSRTMFVSGDAWAYKCHRGYWEDKFTDANSPHVGDIAPDYELELLTSVLEKKDGRLLPFYTPRSMVAFEAGHEFCKRQDAIDSARREVRAKYDELKGVVMATLNKYNSDSKLIAAWPEIEKYIPGQVKKTMAIALDVKTLNAICGLPN